MLFSDRGLRASDEVAGEASAPASASLPIDSVREGCDACPTIDWECDVLERSCASSFPDKPTGTDTTRCNDSGESGRENNGWGIST
jgi:hypothetical protein